MVLDHADANLWRIVGLLHSGETARLLSIASAVKKERSDVLLADVELHSPATGIHLRT